jgi:hypothetical protein
MSIPLGRFTVPTPGTVVALSVKQLKCHAILIEAAPSNTGKVYIGIATMVKGVSGEMAVLAIPTANTIPVYSETISQCPNAINLQDFYVDADIAGDGVVVSYLVT